ncbi:MAG TPA: hypothetical protein VHE99_02185 [Gammaproteobacteria bacterium]|nr:hypothetical protein [Gammaproteobacteria bacterium]
MQLFSWMIGKKLSAAKSLLLSLLILLTSSAILHANITPNKVTLIYANTLYQLSAAINANLCHTQHFIDPNIRKLAGKPLDLNIRLFDIPKLTNPALPDYCGHNILDIASAVKTLNNHEVEEGLPLYWLDRTAMLLFGNITLKQLWMFCVVLQIALIGVFSFYLLSIGIRWPSVWVVTFLAILINVNTLMLAIDVHGFVLPCILAILALYGLSARFGFYQKFLPHILFLIAVTSLEFWLYYARSSELFALLFIMILYCIFLIRKAKSKSAIITLLVAKCIIILVFTWLTAIELGPHATNKTHPVVHMLVLGLNDPPNAFAKQLGIRWNDKNNLKFAQEINPQVHILYTNAYDQAISKYYFLLWKNNTKEMLAVYHLKIYTITSGIIKGLVAHFQSNYGINVGFLFYPFLIMNGYVFVALLMLGILFLLPDVWRAFSNTNYLVLALTMLALLNLLEGILIITALRYLTTFSFYFLVLVYVFWGTVVYAIWTWGKKLKMPRNDAND